MGPALAGTPLVIRAERVIPVAAAFPVTLIGGLYVAMRQVMKSIGGKRRAELEGLVERITRYAGASQPAPEGPERPALPGPRGGSR